MLFDVDSREVFSEVVVWISITIIISYYGALFVEETSSVGGSRGGNKTKFCREARQKGENKKKGVVEEVEEVEVVVGDVLSDKIQSSHPHSPEPEFPSRKKERERKNEASLLLPS